MASFVKLDAGILSSTLWIDRDARDIFITALLMAEPREMLTPTPQIEVGTLQGTGWSAPPGWYGFVPAAGVGIAHRAGVERDKGLAALERLGSPELESRSLDYDGRRMIRVDGGFLVLNFLKYRERDYTAAERSRRWRNRKAAAIQASKPVDTRVGVDDTRDITQAEIRSRDQIGSDPDPPPPDPNLSSPTSSKPPDPERAIPLVHAQLVAVPAAAHTGSVWGAETWRRRFAAAWQQHYGSFYGGGAPDAKASAILEDQIRTLPETALLAAQARAGAMFAEFLDSGAGA